jgi:hypothetical protein
MKREGNGLIYFLVTLKLPAELTTGTEPVPLPHWFPENETQELRGNSLESRAET